MIKSGVNVHLHRFLFYFFMFFVYFCKLVNYV